MSYYATARNPATDDEVDDFDEYDPTPYGGGYDQSLTYGRPLPHSDETCYPRSSSGVDYDRPNQTSYSRPSSAAYGSGYNQQDQAEEENYSRPKPNYSFQPGGYGGGVEVTHQSHYGGGEEEESYSRPQPAYGFNPGINRPGYGEEAPPPPVSEYGSGYGGQQQEYGYGSGYNQGYGRSEEEGYGGRRQEYERPSYGGEEEPRRPVYGRSEYGGVEEEEPRRQSYGSYGRSEEEQPRRYGESGGYGQGDEGEGYGRRQYKNDSEDSDEEKKHSRQQRHHRRHDYDDE